MTYQAITLNLPDGLYEKIKSVSEKTKRPINDLIMEAVAAVAPLESLPDGLRSALAHLAYLNDAALWQAARTTMIAEQRERLESLHQQQQREKLLPQEQAEEQALLALYRETILVRAQAAVLLKQRGYDVADPSQVAPLQ